MWFGLMYWPCYQGNCCTAHVTQTLYKCKYFQEQSHVPISAKLLQTGLALNYKKINQIKLFTNYTLDTGLTESKLTNRFVPCFLKNSLRVLKRFCNLCSF